MRTKAPIHEATAAGLRYLRRAGERGHAVVLLHGIGSRADTFRGLLASYPAGPLLLAWDAPGYGPSAALPGSAPVAADYAARLADLLDALNLDRISLVGHSLGALIVGAFAKRWPERTACVAYVSPALGYGASADQPIEASVQRRIDDLRRLGPERFAAERASRLVGDPERRSDIVAQVRAAMATVNFDGYARAARMLAQGRLIEDARFVKAPALVLVGERDAVTPPSQAARLAAVLRARDAAIETRFSIVADAGHAICQEQPGAVAAALSEFFSLMPMQGAVA